MTPPHDSAAWLEVVFCDQPMRGFRRPGWHVMRTCDCRRTLARSAAA